MRLLANENVPAAVVDDLRAAGHDVAWVRLDSPGGKDEVVLARACREARTVLTIDKDFGEMAFRPGLPAAAGVILVRLRAASPAALAAPFSKEIPDADLWLPPSKESLVADLVAALAERASVLLVGEPGVGKTCVLRALRRRLPQQGFRLTDCNNVTLGRRDFYRQLCVALGLSPSATAAAVFCAVSTHVEDLVNERVHPVFLLDEAHLPHQDTLDHLHILLNYQWDSRALLSLLLVGLPELQDRLALRRNRSLYSRLHHRFVVGQLTPDDTAEYLRVRRRVPAARRTERVLEGVDLGGFSASRWTGTTRTPTRATRRRPGGEAEPTDAGAKKRRRPGGESSPAGRTGGAAARTARQPEAPHKSRMRPCHPFRWTFTGYPLQTGVQDV